VKTSILLLDKKLARTAKEILFLKITDDGFDLGDKRNPIEANDLRIGHYVRIGDRWFDHPFLKGTFLLSTEEELAAIRSADLALIYIDPARSQVAATPTPEDRIPVLQPAPASVARQRRARTRLVRTSPSDC
jgi:hypothetical protein